MTYGDEHEEIVSNRISLLENVAAANCEVYAHAGWIGVPAGYRSVSHDAIWALGRAIYALRRESRPHSNRCLEP